MPTAADVALKPNIPISTAMMPTTINTHLPIFSPLSRRLYTAAIRQAWTRLSGRASAARIAVRHRVG
jgi:hypothetical protein